MQPENTYHHFASFCGKHTSLASYRHDGTFSVYCAANKAHHHQSAEFRAKVPELSEEKAWVLPLIDGLGSESVNSVDVRDVEQRLVS